MKPPLLREDHIAVGLQADCSEEVLRQLVDAIPAWKIDAASKTRIWKQLVVRERVGTTAIGRGIALPHCSSPDVNAPLVVFGVSSDGVPYEALDGRPVHFIFALILPQDDSAERMKRDILQNIKWLLCDRNLQERLKSAHSAHEVFALLTSGVENEPAEIRSPVSTAF